MSSNGSSVLPTAIARVAQVFAGMTAAPGETGCGRCYTATEVALLRIPDVVLPADLVELVAGETPDHWQDQPAVIRRVLPQLVVLLTRGVAAPEGVGLGLAAAGWTRWPDDQARAVEGFLEAWWSWTLRQDSPPTPVREVFESCAIASSSVTPWLARWEAERTPVARRHLSECVHWWRDDLAVGISPFTRWWGAPDGERAACAELAAWLAVQAPQAWGSG